jgi:hypothetical protein
MTLSASAGSGTGSPACHGSPGHLVGGCVLTGVTYAPLPLCAAAISMFAWCTVGCCQALSSDERLPTCHLGEPGGLLGQRCLARKILPESGNR